jgi:predicted nucleic-acid-binding protein
MSQEEVFNTDLLRARLLNVEYKNLTVEEIKRIYIEQPSFSDSLVALPNKLAEPNSSFFFDYLNSLMRSKVISLLYSFKNCIDLLVPYS